MVQRFFARRSFTGPTGLGRRRRWALPLWLLAIVVLAVTALFGYQTGTIVAERETARQGVEIARLDAANGRLELRTAELEAALVAVRRERNRWRARYRDQVPAGIRKELLAALDARLSDGFPPQRLKSYIAGAGAERDCGAKALTKRFLVRTPLTRGANATVSFSRNTITVTGSGRPFTDDRGKPEAWFDPAKPMTVWFTRTGGKSIEIAGRLPLHHVVTIGEAEHRFSVLEGDRRGFVDVTWERCPAP